MHVNWLTAYVAGLCAIVALLGGIAQIIRLAQPELPGIDTAVDIFWVDGDSDVWTWLSSMLELLCAVLVFIIAANERDKPRSLRRYWLGLAILFLAISIDDVAMIHERSDRLFDWLETTGIFHFKWTLWAIPLVILVGLLYLPFLLRLPPGLRWRLILAGGLFLGGAVGIELISSNIAYHQGSSRTYLLITFIEECVEQAGLILFAHTLLTQLANQDIALQVRFTRSHDAERSPSLEMEVKPAATKGSVE